MTSRVTLHVGQVVYWPASPTGFAQVSELRRTNVGLLYRYRNGAVARPIVTAARVAELLSKAPLLFRLDNPFSRGVIPRRKTFELSPPPKHAQAFARREAA